MEDRLFKTRDAAVKAALEYYGGRSIQLLPSDDVPHAMWGIAYWRKLTEEEKTSTCFRTRRGPMEPSVRFLWPRFDVPFEAIVKDVDPEEMTRVMLEAKEGLYAQADDQIRWTLRGCVYDLKNRISVVHTIGLATLRSKALPRTIAIWKESFVRQVDRQNLGGFRAARKEMVDALTPLIWPADSPLNGVPSA